MGFYEQIAQYYEHIFPAGREQLDFISQTAGKPPKKVLDIACGTGEYAISLAAMGYAVWAVDIDDEMVRRAREHISQQNLDVKVETADMLHLNDCILEKFQCAFCIGNSIVHLGSREAILASLHQMKERLYEDGTLVLQIINFDRIIMKGITALPTITDPTAGLVFQRSYNRDDRTGLIHFDTVLTVDNVNRQERYENRVDLFPLMAEELRSMLQEAGFNRIYFYGGFSQEPYHADESYLLVVKASGNSDK